MLHAIILGIVEGLTEFIPVSSSGHLIITRDLLHIQSSNGLAFDAVLQLATALSAVVYFRKDIANLIGTFCGWVTRKPTKPEDRTMLLAIILGTIPAVIFGLLLEHDMETIFRSAHLVAYMLIGGSVLMWCADRYATERHELSVRKGVAVGFFQTLALIPGVSRSGATISGGLLLGLTRETATRFSFLLATPILVASGLKKLLDILKEGGLTSGGFELAVGSIVAFVVGLYAISWLIGYLRTKRLTPFIWYRIALAVVILIFL